ncbi:MAG TPA: glycoside hydrolase family 57 protein, partial [Candidatus Polarisedimenticolia bacterium]|nr:glycoside hydrolase family 57 protein [Candidatus Polarisedimenticolia bacterium]
MARLAVAFLWHQHQPLYKNPRSGRYSLPWVRLHALKDYYDMAALAGEFPRLHLTFNLVPSLLDQIDDYAEGRAADPALDLARRPAADLDEEERLALLDLFFSVPYHTLIAPYPRYAGLYHKRSGRGPDGDYREALSRFRDRDLRDLQVWFHLAWCGQTLRGRAEVKELLAKGEGFTEDEKGSLLDVQAAFMKEIVPIHMRLKTEGIAEISTSPYYHPILPLLCNLESAREALPGLPLPEQPFRRRGDAEFQVREALASMERRFGERPLGMWPSEGSLSEETIRIFGEARLTWTASDEGVLRGSAGRALQAGDIHKPYLLAGAETGPVIFFRDHRLSDLVGFTYATWPPRAAAEDFLGRLRALAVEAPGGVVSVVLDGENAWEHYEGNGVEFLRALYAGLTSDDDLQTVTLTQAAQRAESIGRLEHLRAGSWIGANFATWIGHPEKNTAWSLLAAARSEAQARLTTRLESHPVFRILAAAEGSDWFWWYGDD